MESPHLIKFLLKKDKWSNHFMTCTGECFIPAGFTDEEWMAHLLMVLSHGESYIIPEPVSRKASKSRPAFASRLISKAGVALAGTVVVPAESETGGKEHKCSICCASFPTGQALGGHKRKHFTGTINRAKRLKCDNLMEVVKAEEQEEGQK